MDLTGRTWALAAHPEGGSQTPEELPAQVWAPRPPGKTGSKVAVRLLIPRPRGLQWGLRVGSLPAWPVLLCLWT